MLHHLTGAIIQVANLANYNCHPLEDGNNGYELVSMGMLSWSIII